MPVGLLGLRTMRRRLQTGKQEMRWPHPPKLRRKWAVGPSKPVPEPLLEWIVWWLVHAWHEEVRREPDGRNLQSHGYLGTGCRSLPIRLQRPGPMRRNLQTERQAVRRPHSPSL